MSKIPGPDRWLYRFVAGQPLDGHYRTDARFHRAGKRLLSKVEVHRWSYLPGWQRAAVRLSVVAGIPAAIWQYVTNPTRTVTAGAVVAAVCLSAGLWRLWQAWRRHEVSRDFLRPLHAVLAPVFGLPTTQRPGDYIEVPRSYRSDEATPARIRLPKTFNPTPANRQTIADIALAKLGLNEDNTDVIYRLVGDPVLELKMAPQPPKRVTWADEIETMRALPPGQIFVGRGARDKAYIRDFNAGEVVHGGFSVNTGGGKSNAAIGWIAQMLHSDRNTTVTFIDPKQSALPACLVGVPGYTLANDPDEVPEMWDAIERFEREIDRRRRARLLDPTLEFPLMYLFIDELSEFMDMTRETWEYARNNPGAFGYGENDKLDKRPPIIRSTARILRMSREFGGRVLVFTQRLDNASTGGIGLRDLLGWRGLGGFRKNQWMMLIGTMPVPKSIRRVGRWIYSDGDKEVWVQNVYGTPEEFRDWAMYGRRGVVDTHAEHSNDDGVSPGDSTASVQGYIVGLQAGADYLGMKLGTFRKQRQRAGGIPGEKLRGRSPCWTREQLDNFVAKVDA